jgi:DNA-binding beta-propeller fold protein YncE
MRTLVACLTGLVLTTGPVAAQHHVIALPTNDLIYDSGRQRIYASVPSRAGAERGNTVTVINPATGEIGPSVFVGSEPARLALSDDGQFLYVGLDGAAAVRRVDLASGTAGLQFSLGSDSFFGSYYVEDMEVMPGQPGTVAISRRFTSVSPRHAGVAIYDNGVRQPTTTQGHTGSNVIEFAATASRLYGYNNESTEFGFRRLDVGPTGVTELDAGTLFDGFGVDMEFDGGRIFASNGAVVDPEARRLLGSFSLPMSSTPLVRPATDIGRVFFLTDDTVRIFDATTFVLLDTLEVPDVAGRPGSLIRWGATGLAFRTDTDQVFIIGDVSPVLSPTITVSLTGCTACAPGSTFAVSATVSNPGSRAVPVEVKAGVVMPSGAELNVWSAGNRHYETTLAPGTSIAVEILRATLPAGLSAGTWFYEAALLSPELGRTLSRSAERFQIAPASTSQP